MCVSCMLHQSIYSSSATSMWCSAMQARKFVNDDTSHSGTQQCPAGSKEHQMRGSSMTV